MDSIGKKVIKVYIDPFEEKEKKDAELYTLRHPECRVENKKYAFDLSDENFLIEKLKYACTRKIHTWTYHSVDCDLEIVGEENESGGTVIYGFFKYKPVTVPFICVYDYSLEKAFVYTFKKVEDTNNYDFESLLEDFLVEHTEFQHIYQSDSSKYIIR